MKNFKYIALSLFVGAAVTSCSTSKTLVSNGEYDDMYGTSSDGPVAYAPSVSKSSEAYSPEYLTDYNDAYDRMPAETSSEGVEGTDTYFDENYVSANSLKRAYTPDAGYTSGYAEGYAEGWSDYAWSGSSNMNSWNSFNNPFGGYGFNSFGYSPFNSGFGSYLGMGSLAYGGFYGINSFGSSRFGMNSFGYSPYGYNSFGYSPWGYSSYGMYSAYGNGYGNSYYGVQPVLASDSRYSGSRSYGPRSSTGGASSLYNDGFVNTRKPVATASSARLSTGTSTADSRSSIASRANGRTYTTASRPASYDAYTRSSASSVSSSSRSASNSGLSRTTASPRSSANTYSRTATRARSYTPSSSSTGNSGYSRSSTPTRTNSTYSKPAATSTRSLSPSTGSYSRGSSSSSSSSSSARPR